MPLLRITLVQSDGVEVGAEAEVTDDDIAGLLSVLVDMTGATTAISGTNPDAPPGGLVEDLPEDDPLLSGN